MKKSPLFVATSIYTVLLFAGVSNVHATIYYQDGGIHTINTDLSENVEIGNSTTVNVETGGVVRGISDPNAPAALITGITYLNVNGGEILGVDKTGLYAASDGVVSHSPLYLNMVSGLIKGGDYSEHTPNIPDELPGSGIHAYDYLNIMMSGGEIRAGRKSTTSGDAGSDGIVADNGLDLIMSAGLISGGYSAASPIGGGAGITITAGNSDIALDGTATITGGLSENATWNGYGIINHSSGDLHITLSGNARVAGGVAVGDYTNDHATSGIAGARTVLMNENSIVQGGGGAGAGDGIVGGEIIVISDNAVVEGGSACCFEDPGGDGIYVENHVDYTHTEILLDGGRISGGIGRGGSGDGLDLRTTSAEVTVNSGTINSINTSSPLYSGNSYGGHGINSQSQLQLNIHGGEISGGTSTRPFPATTYNSGNGLYLDGQTTLNMTNGLISGGDIEFQSTHGGSAVLALGDLNADISNGVIRGGSVDGLTGTQIVGLEAGHGIQAASRLDLTLNGAAIQGGHAGIGGDAINSSGEMHISLLDGELTGGNGISQGGAAIKEELSSTGGNIDINGGVITGGGDTNTLRKFNL